MKSGQPHNKLTIAALFLLIVVDTMGISVVFPVFAPLFLGANSAFLDPNISPFLRNAIYGLSLAVFPFCMFIGAPLLGQLSDNIGRKKGLVLCLFMTAIGYGISAIGITAASLGVLLLGRAVAGLFAGSQAIAQAAIADISSPETKANNMGMIVLAYSAGIILGPLLSGFTASGGLYFEFTYATPFMFAALLAFLNGLLLMFSFRETFEPKNKTISLIGGVYLVLTAFKMQNIRVLSLSFICMILAWSLYFQSIGSFMLESYRYESRQIGLFMGFMGLISAISLTIGIKLIFQWLKLPTLVYAFCMGLVFVANALTSITPNETHQWLLVVPNALGAAIAYAVGLAIFSNSADANSQGMMMGITGCLTALAWTLTALAAGFMGYMNIHLPYMVASGLGLVSLVFMLVIHSRTTAQLNTSALAAKE